MDLFSWDLFSWALWLLVPALVLCGGLAMAMLGVAVARVLTALRMQVRNL